MIEASLVLRHEKSRKKRELELGERAPFFFDLTPSLKTVPVPARESNLQIRGRGNVDGRGCSRFHLARCLSANQVREAQNIETLIREEVW